MEVEEKERDPKPGLLGLVMLDYIWFILNHVKILCYENGETN